MTCRSSDRSRARSTASRPPAIGVVIRDGDRPEAALERLVEQVVDRRRTVRRVVRVHVQVREDERAVGARRRQRAAASGSPPRRKLAVQRLDLGGNLGEGLSRGDGASGARETLAQRDVLEQSERDRACELGGVGGELEAAHIGLDQLQRRRALRRGDRDAGSERLERETPRAVARRDEHRGAAQQQLACARESMRVPCGSPPERARARARRYEDDLRAERCQRPGDGPRSAATARRGLDEHAGRGEELRIARP